MKRSIQNIVRASDELSKLRSYLQERTAPLAVTFVDLVGSTALKRKAGQAEWLPTICRFLLLVTELVEQCRGRVVKYIGDEVLAVFSHAEGSW